MALCVELIRRLWHRGLYTNNPWMKRCHDYWFDTWVEFRTELTMNSVDRQIEELNPEPVKMVEPTFTETLEGETALGGEMRLTHESFNKDLDT